MVGIRRRKEQVQCRELIKVSELSKRVNEQEYTEKVRMAYEKNERHEIRSVEDEWKELSDAVLKCATEVFVVVDGWQGIRKRSELWNDKLRIAVLQKRKIFEQWLQKGSEQAFDVHRKERRRAKTVVREAKRDAEDRFGTKISQNFEGNRKMFWIEVKRGRKRVQGEEG